jgi:hypothetical protein
MTHVAEIFETMTYRPASAIARRHRTLRRQTSHADGVSN